MILFVFQQARKQKICTENFQLFSKSFKVIFVINFPLIFYLMFGSLLCFFWEHKILHNELNSHFRFPLKWILFLVPFYWCKYKTCENSFRFSDLKQNIAVNIWVEQFKHLSWTILNSRTFHFNVWQNSLQIKKKKTEPFIFF